MIPQDRPRVIGIGNWYRQDDGAGLAVARAMSGRAGDRFDVTEHAGDGTSLLDIWDRARVVVVVDAVRSGAAPGTIHRMNVCADGIPEAAAWSSSHSIGLADAVTLATRLGSLPANLFVYGIEGGRFGFGSELSAEVAEAVHAVVDEICRQFSPPAPTAEDRS